MLKLFIRRLAQLPAVMFVLSVLVIGMTQLLPLEQRALAYAQGAKQEERLEEIIRERRLDAPFAEQYGRWFSLAVQGDLGYSQTSKQPVIQTIRERLPATLELTLVTVIPIIALSVWLGTISALHKDRLIDQLVRVFVVLGYSLPTFVLAIVLLVVLYGYLGWLPGPGRVDTQYEFDLLSMNRPTGLLVLDALLEKRWALAWDAVRHLVMPALTLIIVLSANLVKATRSSMLEVLSSDYVRTAQAKGLNWGVVVNKHARRNALLPIITLSGFLVVGLLSGSIITETVFSYPGIGLWFVEAARRLDLPAILGFTLLSAFVVVLVSTITDLLYSLVDPRVRFD